MKKKLSASTKAHKNYEQVAKKSAVGTGARFKAVVESAKASGAENPQAVAAAIGRKKYGPKKMAAMAAAKHKHK